MDAFYLASLIQILVPQPCFDKFFVEFDFLDVECLKITISKCLGFGIILGSVLVKVPQIVKIQRAKSAEGISMLSVTLELVAIVSTLSYSYSKGYPFSAYGEAVFLLLQTSIISFLVLLFSGQSSTAVIYTALVYLTQAFLISPAAPQKLLWLLQAGVMFNVIFARFIQAGTNFRNGHTGQLSVITAVLLFVGSLARVFTSQQETGDFTVVMTYLVSTFCNGVIFFQILYYWSAKSDKVKAA